MSSKPVLHSYFRSSASWRVRIALAYKGIEYEYKPVHLVKREQKADSYTEMNPMAQVPTLQMDGLTMTQSLPIIEYLEEVHPENPLLPHTAALRFQARRIAEVINSGIQPLQNFSVMNRIGELTGDDQVKMQWSAEWIEKGIKALEKILSETAGTYCVGDELSIADVCLIPQVYNAKRFKVDLSACPTVERVVAACLTLPAFQAADPLNQPDCPPELK